jgi:hypothetical protein
LSVVKEERLTNIHPPSTGAVDGVSRMIVHSTRGRLDREALGVVSEREPSFYGLGVVMRPWLTR